MTIGPRSIVLGGLGFVLALMTPPLAAQQPSELLIRNGTIVNATGQTQGDVRIVNGTVTELGTNLDPVPARASSTRPGNSCSPAASIPTCTWACGPASRGPTTTPPARGPHWPGA